MKKNHPGRKAFAVIGLALVTGSVSAQATLESNTLTGTTTAPNEYLGSSNNFDVVFKSNGTERARFTAGGALGIGITTPARPFHVQTGSTNSGIRVTQTTTGFSALELFNSSTGGRNWAAVSTGNGNGEGAGNFGIFDYTGGGHKLFILGSNGNVGIGTTGPIAKLHVNGGGVFSSSTSPTSAPYLRSNSGYSTVTTPDFTWWNNDRTGFFHPAADEIGVTIDGGEEMRVVAGGVGIGASVPLERLHVIGNILAAGNSPTSAPFIRATSAYSTASAPDFTWYNNLQTGLFHPNANIMGFTNAGTEVMRIHSNNSVGIGTTTPYERLQVGSRMTFHDGGVKIFGYNFYYDGQSKRIAADYSMGMVFGTAGEISFMTAPSGAANSVSTFITPFTILNNGNVGVGITNPTEKFVIANGANKLTFHMNSYGDIVSTGSWSPHFANGGSFNVYKGTAPGADLMFSINSNADVWMAPYTGSKVRIGPRNVTSGAHTDYALAVDGKVVVSGSVHVDPNGWADYVFGENYQPMSLSSLEAYYKEHKHLPEIPSETEVKENGIDLGEMNKLLLKKVEELTLYLVEQNKRIEELEKAAKK